MLSIDVFKNYITFCGRGGNNIKHYITFLDPGGINYVIIVGPTVIKSTKIDLLGPETARWCGGLPLKGVGVEKFVSSLESSFRPFDTRGKLTFSPGCRGEFRQDVPDLWGGVQNVCGKRVCVCSSAPFIGCWKEVCAILLGPKWLHAEKIVLSN